MYRGFRLNRYGPQVNRYSGVLRNSKRRGMEERCAAKQNTATKPPAASGAKARRFQKPGIALCQPWCGDSPASSQGTSTWAVGNPMKTRMALNISGTAHFRGFLPVCPPTALVQAKDVKTLALTVLFWPVRPSAGP